MDKRKKLFINDLYTEFEFESFPDSSKIKDEIKIDYIKEMIALAKSDKQATFLYFGFALAAIAFLIDTFDNLGSKAGFWYLLLFYLGITCLAISAIFFFTYWRKIHKCHMNIISCIPSLNIDKTKDLWINLWIENKKYFKNGLLLLIVGIVLLFIVIIITRLSV